MGQMDYETYVGLEMNRSRARLRRVFFEGLAVSLATGRGEVPFEIIRAGCDSEDQAKKLWFEINAARDAASKGW